MHKRVIGAATAAERFWPKVSKSETCWEWQASLDILGYGKFGYNKQWVRAHRLSWAMSHGDPGDLCVLHHCDNRRCVNPAHLFLGTVVDNNADRVRKGRTITGHVLGEQKTNAKLTNILVTAARYAYVLADVHPKTLARACGVARQTMERTLARQIWRHV